MKKAAIINDLSGIGRCSLSVALSILPTLNIQACPLPTAILSNQTGFKEFSFLDFTPYMRGYFEHWKKIGYEFDSIYSGFLGSTEQIEIITEFIKAFKQEKTLVLIDPVMGDNGALYSIYPNNYPEHMKQLIAYADVITPNFTEFCLLTGYDMKFGVDKDKIYDYAKKLAVLGPKQIVITGMSQIEKPHQLINVGIDFEQGDYFEEKVAYNGVSYSGTGDLFASIVCGYLTRGEKLKYAVREASTFISKAILYTEDFKMDTNEGILYEKFLKELR